MSWLYLARPRFALLYAPYRMTVADGFISKENIQADPIETNRRGLLRQRSGACSRRHSASVGSSTYSEV